MIKIGITGSLASGKTTVAKMFSRGKYPLFNADTVVRKIYKTNKKESKIYNDWKRYFEKTAYQSTQ